MCIRDRWGFPEVWVEVPEQSSPSRPAGLRPGVTIYLLEGGAFRSAAHSRAFAGWTAAEIHRALNEPELSQATLAALRRVGRALGAAAGTGPDDDPQMRTERRDSRAEGRLEGRTEMLREAVLQVLRSRGLPVSAELPRHLARLQGVSTAALVKAALHCRDEEDFLRRARGKQQ